VLVLNAFFIVRVFFKILALYS